MGEEQHVVRLREGRWHSCQDESSKETNDQTNNNDNYEEHGNMNQKSKEDVMEHRPSNLTSESAPVRATS